MERAYKFRIYPNQQQKILLAKTFGCVRFVHNYYLDKKIKLYKESGVSISNNECSRDLTVLKQELEWLKEPDKCALQNALRDLDTSYKNFLEIRLILGFQSLSRNETITNHIEQLSQMAILRFLANILNFQTLVW